MDLFLDTFPYNGHTTVIEAIRRKVPTLTLAGDSFASRVAGSILNSIGLNQLITENLDDYVKTAIDLSLNKEKFFKIRQQLKKDSTLALFNSQKYTKNLENLFLNVLEENN